MKKIKYLYKLLMAYVPRRLPMGVEEFNRWANDLVEISGLPNNDSMRFSIGVVIMNSRTKKDRFGNEVIYDTMSQMEIIRALRKGAANQVASYIMNEIKAKQEAAVAANQVVS